MKRADEAIGGRDIVDPGKRQLRGQAILQRAEHPLAAPRASSG
jgi:hypothetical protein